MEKSIPADAALQQGHRTEYIGLIRAMQILKDKYQATIEELAAWIFWGPEHGGIVAYIGAFNPPKPFSFSYASTCRNYLPLLNKCCFRRDDIKNFKPIERYITGKVLFKRWGHVEGGPSSFIRARIEESRLLPLHPTFGSTREVFEETASDTHWPTLEEGLFLLEHIKLIEAEEGLFPPKEETLIARDKREILAHSLKGKVIPQEQQFRGLCIDELRKFARRWVGDSTEIPIKGVILYNYHSKWSPYFKRRDQDFRCPLYVVVFELPGLEWPPPREDSRKWPLMEEDICAPSVLDGHPWQDFLEKLDNIPDQRFKENSHFLLYPGFEHVYDSTPGNTWKQEWLFVAVDDLNSLPEYVDRDGPVQVLVPLTPVQKQPTADQATSVAGAFEQLGLISKELEGWFDKDFDELPEGKRQMINGLVLHRLWDNLPPEQRRDAALQRDYQHDPATEEERKHYWGLYSRQYELEIELKEWQTIPTPTAVDLETQKRKLRECQEEINRIQLQLNEPHNQSPKGSIVGNQSTPATVQVADDVIEWTWPGLEKITRLSRKTIQKRANDLDIKFENRPPKKGHKPEIGLKESNWRRIVKKK